MVTSYILVDKDLKDGLKAACDALGRDFNKDMNQALESIFISLTDEIEGIDDEDDL